MVRSPVAFFSRSTGRFPTMDLSLHEINIPRNWPTEVGTDVPIRHVWHSCRTDLEDLMCKYRGIEDIDREKDHTLRMVKTDCCSRCISQQNALPILPREQDLGRCILFCGEGPEISR